MSNKSLIYCMDFKLLLNYGLMFICHENIQTSYFSISKIIIPFNKWYVVIFHRSVYEWYMSCDLHQISFPENVQNSKYLSENNATVAHPELR